jgi:hypothetical protein
MPGLFSTEIFSPSDNYLLLFCIAIPNGDEEPLVKVSREEFERELLVVPRIVVILD